MTRRVEAARCIALETEGYLAARHAQTGWKVAFAAMIALIPNSASIGLYAQGYFLGPMTAEFGWTRTQFMTPVSISIVALALMYPVVGYCGDRWGIRPVLLIGIVVFGFTTMALGLLGGNYLQYSMLTIVVGVSAIVQSPLLYAKAIAGWASNRSRGLALAVGASGVPLGNFLIPPITVFLITQFGWRGARAGLGALILICALPMCMFFIREPERLILPAAVRGFRDNSREFRQRFRQLVRDRTFLLLATTFGLSGLALNGLLAHLIPMLTDAGFSIYMATVSLSIMAIAQVCGRLISGWLLDRVQTPRVGLVWLALGILGIALIGGANRLALVIPAVILIGVALGSEVELAAYFSSRYFDLVHFGENYGLLAAAYTLGSALGSLMLGLSFDRTGSYRIGIGVVIAMLVLSCIATMALPLYPTFDEAEPVR
jgi:MFS family permease